ncbi:peptide deformylase [Patescibacteria group bacterium]|nr:peptide deformylase [Patescibacteria group bacterium]
MEDKKTTIKIFIKGEKVLRQKAQDVPVDKITSKKFQNIIKKMEKVIYEKDDALAVAAPQIGESWRITVISEWALGPYTKKLKTEFKNMVFINPVITNASKAQKNFPEGCLSAPNSFGEVKRAEKVKVEAYDRDGNKFTRGASGLLAQTIQHEIDHLNGILFIDKAENLTNPDTAG